MGQKTRCVFMWERFWELLRWDFPKFYCESHNGAPFSDEVGENPGGSSEDWNLEPKKTNNRTKHARPHPQTHTDTHRRPCLYTGPDMVLRVEGTRAASTGYDKKSYYTRARATFIDEQFFMSFFHFWSLLPITIKLNLLHVSRWSC